MEDEYVSCVACNLCFVYVVDVRTIYYHLFTTIYKGQHRVSTKNNMHGFVCSQSSMHSSFLRNQIEDVDSECLFRAKTTMHIQTEADHIYLTNKLFGM
jgi:hypothetical protein